MEIINLFAKKDELDKIIQANMDKRQKIEQEIDTLVETDVQLKNLIIENLENTSNFNPSTDKWKLFDVKVTSKTVTFGVDAINNRCYLGRAGGYIIDEHWTYPISLDEI